VQCIQKMIQ